MPLVVVLVPMVLLLMALELRLVSLTCHDLRDEGRPQFTLPKMLSGASCSLRVIESAEQTRRR